MAEHQEGELGWFARQRGNAVGLVALVGSRLRGARDTRRPVGNLAEARRAGTTARQLEPELEILNRLGLGEDQDGIGISNPAPSGT